MVEPGHPFKGAQAYSVKLLFNWRCFSMLPQEGLCVDPRITMIANVNVINVPEKDISYGHGVIFLMVSAFVTEDDFISILFLYLSPPAHNFLSFDNCHFLLLISVCI